MARVIDNMMTSRQHDSMGDGYDNMTAYDKHEQRWNYGL
jgi:hypothetical protein